MNHNDLFSCVNMVAYHIHLHSKKNSFLRRFGRVCQRFAISGLFLWCLTSGTDDSH